MKKLFVLLVLTFFFFITHAQTGIRDKEVFVRSIFAAVQENDSAAFLKLYPSKAAFVDLYNAFIEEIPDSIKANKQHEKLSLNYISDEVYLAAIKTSVSSQLTRIRQQAKKMNIDLAKASYTSWKEDVFAYRKISLAKKYFNGCIYFTYDTKEYCLIFSDVNWSEKDQSYGNVIIGPILKKGDELSLQTDSVSVEEVNITSVEYAPDEKNEPPPPAKKRTTVKKATSSPAKKTTIKH